MAALIVSVTFADFVNYIINKNMKKGLVWYVAIGLASLAILVVCITTWLQIKMINGNELRSRESLIAPVEEVQDVHQDVEDVHHQDVEDVHHQEFDDVHQDVDDVHQDVDDVHQDIPKNIWTFWQSSSDTDKDEVAIVNACLNTWRKFLPDYKIFILDEKTSRQYMKGGITRKTKGVDSWARYTDILRLEILAEHGGFWIDSSFILTQNLDWVHESFRQNPGTELVCFYIDANTTVPHWPVVESWFLACPKKSPIMKLWLDEFRTFFKYSSPEEYIKGVVRKGVNLQKLNWPDYLTIHVSMQAVLQLKDVSRNRYVAFKAEDGPFLPHFLSQWDDSKTIDRICSYRPGEAPSLIKLRSVERQTLAHDKKKKCSVLLLKEN